MRWSRLHRSLAVLALGSLVFCDPSIAQQQQPSPSPSPAPSPGSPGRTPTPTPGTPTPGQPGREPQFPGSREQQPMQEIERPLFLSGKVVLEDGTPPPDSVIIETVCNGMPRPEAYTDSKGRFSFQLGQNRNLIPDASVSSNSDAFGGFGRNTGGGMSPGGGSRFGSDTRLLGCELRANLAGFRSTLVNLTGRRMMENPDVGTIILRRLGNVEGTTISVTSLAAPKEAKKSYDKGAQANKKGKWQDAQKHLEKAVEAYPRYATAWYELGVAYQQQQNVEKARDAYQKALAADAKFLKPYVPLASMAYKEQKWQEVIDTTDRLLRLDPVDYPGAFLYNSIANFQLRKLDAAEKSAREALKLDPDHRMPKIEQVLGVILANKRDYTSAAQHLKNYLNFAPDAQDAPAVRNQIVELEAMTATNAPAQPQPQQ